MAKYERIFNAELHLEEPYGEEIEDITSVLPLTPPRSSEVSEDRDPQRPFPYSSPTMGPPLRSSAETLLFPLGSMLPLPLGSTLPLPVGSTLPLGSTLPIPIPAAEDALPPYSAPSLPSVASLSPVSALWAERKRSDVVSAVPVFKGNVKYKDACVNTDSSMFYEGAPLFYQQEQQQHQHQQHQQQHHQQQQQQQHQNQMVRPIAATTTMPSKIPPRPFRPPAFIDNLSTITPTTAAVLEGSDAPPSPTDSSPSSLLDIVDLEKGEKGVVGEASKGEKTPRAATAKGEKTPRTKRAKILSALARVGIKTSSYSMATRAKRDFHPLVMENSGED